MTKKLRRSNAERVATTRGALLEAAARLFGHLGYEATSTTAVLEAAGLARGALYHHFADKRALFVAVAEELERELTAEIEAATADIADPRQRLRAGVRLYLDGASRPDRARVLLRDAPAVLGPDLWRDLADAAWTRHLGAMLRGLAGGGLGAALPLLLGAAFDRAALAMSEEGADREGIRASAELLLERLLA
jgi:AcrR family transcriptional regulator